MIHNDIQNQLQLLIKTSAPPLIEVAQDTLGLPQWTPGQRVPAHVLASLPNGRFEVLVGDQTLDLNLPANTQAGDTLELTFLASSPRLTFTLTRDLANTLAPNNTVSLSETAKFLGSLLQKGGEPGEVTQMARSVPVMSAPPSDTGQLAHSLRQAVSQSGLFYESHQVQWLSGERPVEALLREPQGKLSPILQPPEARAAVALPAAEEMAKSASLDLPKSESLHPQTTQLVQQQLQTLDTRQIVWQGQIWPGQDMKWEIEEEEQRQRGEDLEASHWQTRLNLQLPSLGGVSAKLALINGAVKIDIVGDQADSVSRMQLFQEALATRFAASGLNLAGLHIRHEQG